MGKTPKPLSFLVAAELAEWPEFRSLAEQGHEVHTPDDQLAHGRPLGEYDLVMGPTCWVMDGPRRAYLAIAIAEARKARYPQQKPKGKVTA